MEKRCNQCNTLSREQAQQSCAFPDCPHKAAEESNDQSKDETSASETNAPGNTEELKKNGDDSNQGGEGELLDKTPDSIVPPPTLEGNDPGDEQPQ